MNYAMVNLSFRGFDVAQQSFKRALEMRPNDYDAHLGMALALRVRSPGATPTTISAFSPFKPSSTRPSGSIPSRPDAYYYNEGILTQEFKAKAGGDKEKVKATLRQAETIFKTFLEKAEGKPEYEGAIKRVKGDPTVKNDEGQLGDIKDTIALADLDTSK